jgi:hypothetical protein
MVVHLLEKTMDTEGWTKNKKVRAHMFMPPRLGGPGFRQMGGGSAAAAVLASMSAAYNVDTSMAAEPNGFKVQIKKFNSHVEHKDKLPTEYLRCMGALSEYKKAGKKLCGLIRERQAKVFEASLTHLERVRLEAYRVKFCLMYLLVPCTGSVLRLTSQSDVETLSPDQYRYLFRRFVIGDDNPHSLDMTGAEVCGRIFASSGNVCTCALDIRLSHMEWKCAGTRGGAKHQALQNAVVHMARESGLTAVPSAPIPGSKNHGDVVVSGHARCSLMLDVKSYGIPEDATVGRVTTYLAAQERVNMEFYQGPCREARMKFPTCILSVEGFFGGLVPKALGPLATSLEQTDMVSKAEAFTKLRVCLQSAMMRQVAINGMVAMESVRAKMYARHLLGNLVQRDVQVREDLHGQQDQQEVTLSDC